MRAFITGVAGFIGFHLARRLLQMGWEVAGVDALTPYYDPKLKKARLRLLAAEPRFRFTQAEIEDHKALAAALQEADPQLIVHLAAQPGVRYSFSEPRSYISANLVGTFELLEAVRRLTEKQPGAIQHLLVASTSSVYGALSTVPFSEEYPSDWPLSLYAATKKGCEALAHVYAHLWKIPTTVFRFFTVYGPWGRPDMALFKFTEAILKGKPIEVYQGGALWRDFTYIDDLIEAIVRLMPLVPTFPESGESDSKRRKQGLSPAAPYRVVNIGAGAPVQVADFIQVLEEVLGCKAVRCNLPMQPGEMPRTFADTHLLEALTGYRPSTPLRVGIERFVAWYRAWQQQEIG